VQAVVRRAEECTSYLGLIRGSTVREESSNWARSESRGNRPSAGVLVEAAQSSSARTIRISMIFASLPRKPKGVAKVEAARKLAIGSMDAAHKHSGIRGSFVSETAREWPGREARPQG